VSLLVPVKELPVPSKQRISFLAGVTAELESPLVWVAEGILDDAIEDGDGKRRAEKGMNALG
jgi:hypothetical protein